MMRASRKYEAYGMQAHLIGAGERLHLQHGPIDMIIDADGHCRNEIFEIAVQTGMPVLDELVEELHQLRAPHRKDNDFKGPVARRMQAACNMADGQFVTPMIAVAGAVADHILSAILESDAAHTATKISVNNGGDIAFWTAPGAMTTARIAGIAGGQLMITGPTMWRGIATSGWQGRSHSLGVADSVTVLARNAATADIAATLIANAVNPADETEIIRMPANSLNPDSDLGDRLVTTGVPLLDKVSVDSAIRSGAAVAQQMLNKDQIAGAVISLQGHNDVVGMTADTIGTTRLLPQFESDEIEEYHA